MRQVMAYPLKYGKFTLQIPAGGRTLSVGRDFSDHGKPKLWVLLNPFGRHEVEREFLFVANGQEIQEEDSLQYIGTLTSAGGDESTIHLFEVIP